LRSIEAGRSRLGCCVAGLLIGLMAAGSASAQGLRDFVPVGVRYRPAAQATDVRRDLEEMRRLRFNVVSVVKQTQPPRLSYIDRLLAGAPYPEVLADASAETAVIPIGGTREAITLDAWSALARGARVFLFGDWVDLERNPDSLTAAAEFAEAVTRNAALYAALRPRPPGDLRIAAPAPGVEAALLQSSDAWLLVALNRTGSPRDVTISFAPEVPEAIWRNMFNGGSVSFVTGPNGTMYSRTFGPHEVVVLTIGREVR
jgi:hypothetical protein